MQNYSVELAASALEQLEEIRDYVRSTLQAPETAQRLITRLQQEIRSLAAFPNRFPLTNEEIGQKNGLHKMPVGNYLVYYQVFDDRQQVIVLAVLYGRRDQKAALEQV